MHTLETAMQQTENHYYLKPKLKPNLQSNFFISNFDITSYIIFISYLKVVTSLYLRTSVTFYFFLFDIATSATSFV